MKRKLFMLLASLPLFAGCATGKSAAVNEPIDDPLRNKFRGIRGVVLRLDAATPKKFITITSETGRRISGPGSLALNKVGNQTYTDNSLPIPKIVHVTWRKGAARYDEGIWTGGTVIGDYTVPVAERIPDDILDYIRKNGGALRLKIRLKDDGVLVGWDVEKRLPKPGCTVGVGETCYGLHYLLPGGDFREAQIRDGKVIDPGWEK